ncbi:MAG: hypothetical protein ACOYLS_06150 [Polymorphobacter sp.]
MPQRTTRRIPGIPPPKLSEKGAKTPENHEKRAGVFTPARKSILGEDRHIGLIFVHCNTDFCNAKNTDRPNYFTRSSP